jgi:hypothetical protein
MRLIQVACLLMATIPFAGSARAEGPKEYAYLYLQGRLYDPAHGTPLRGAEIRLTAGAQAFQVTTDSRGNFVFEKLPMATYEMHVTTAEGRVIRTIEEIGLKVSGPRRYRAKLSRGPEVTPVIEAGKKGVAVSVPVPPVRWKRFWKQFAIFAGGALVLAL